MRCLKSFGGRIASRDPDRQTTEVHIRIALMDRFNAFGALEIERMACALWGKGKSRLIAQFYNNAICNPK